MYPYLIFLCISSLIILYCVYEKRMSLLFFQRNAYLDKTITQREKVGSAIQKSDLSRIMTRPSEKWKSVSKRKIICVKPITMVKDSDVGKVMSSRSNRHK